MGSGGRAGSGTGVRGGCAGGMHPDEGAEIRVSWQELSALTSGKENNNARRLRSHALEVLGHPRGPLVIAELDAGRMPRLKPVRE